MARMTLGETLTNLMWAKISSLKDIKCSGKLFLMNYTYFKR